MESNNNTKIKVENLSKVFGNKKQIDKALNLLDEDKTKAEILEESGATVGVNKADLDIKEGEIFVVMGLSGSGKSTLVRMLNRLIEPTDGSVYIDGEDIMQMDKDELREVRRKKISMVFQNFGLFPHRTILENTEYGLEVQDVPKEERQEKAERALDNAGLLPYKDQLPNQLSGGMQQRVGLARALANDPQILLMDEAFSALDPLIRRDMQDELIEMQERMQKTVIFITHDLNESLRIGDRIAIMRDGEVVQVGTGEEILTNPANEYVRRFVEDVDRSKIITAENIMERPQTITMGHDGPRIAKQRMQQDSLNNMLVVNKQKELLGYVTDQDVLKAISDDLTIEDILRKGVPEVSPEKLMSELYDMIHDSETPVAVTNDDHRLLGIIVRSHVLNALAKDNNKESDIDG